MQRVPIVDLVAPPFTIEQLRAAVPVHCWERSTAWSFLLLGRGVALAATLWWLCGALDSLAEHWAAQVLLWTLFALVQGCVLYGPWIVGHECGHGRWGEAKRSILV